MYGFYMKTPTGPLCFSASASKTARRPGNFGRDFTMGEGRHFGQNAAFFCKSMYPGYMVLVKIGLFLTKRCSFCDAECK
jgi:hypothetical protein